MKKRFMAVCICAGLVTSGSVGLTNTWRLHPDTRAEVNKWTSRLDNQKHYLRQGSAKRIKLRHEASHNSHLPYYPKILSKCDRGIAKTKDNIKTYKRRVRDAKLGGLWIYEDTAIGQFSPPICEVSSYDRKEYRRQQIEIERTAIRRKRELEAKRIKEAEAKFGNITISREPLDNGTRGR